MKYAQNMTEIKSGKLKTTKFFKLSVCGVLKPNSKMNVKSLNPVMQIAINNAIANKITLNTRLFMFIHYLICHFQQAWGLYYQ